MVWICPQQIAPPAPPPPPHPSQMRVLWIFYIFLAVTAFQGGQSGWRCKLHCKWRSPFASQMSSVSSAHKGHSDHKMLAHILRRLYKAQSGSKKPEVSHLRSSVWSTRCEADILVKYRQISVELIELLVGRSESKQSLSWLQYQVWEERSKPVEPHQVLGSGLPVILASLRFCYLPWIKALAIQNTSILCGSSVQMAFIVKLCLGTVSSEKSVRTKIGTALTTSLHLMAPNLMYCDRRISIYTFLLMQWQ